MLSEERNRELTEVGPGTPMGELLRRYWHPIAAADELEARPTKSVKILGEELTLYRDGSGQLGLIDRHCPHRRADMSYGIIEPEGIRCNYHGWLFSGDGRCLHQPFEEVVHPDARFRDKTRIKAYQAREHAGLIWGYMGPDPAPEVPDWEFFHAHGFKQIAWSIIPCNWFQCQENSIDPVHFEWLHANWGAALKGRSNRAPTHLRLAFDEFEYGFVYRRIREDTTEDHELWTTGRVCLWPNALYTHPCEWRVPIDDGHTLSIAFFNDPLPGDEPFEQQAIPSWEAPTVDPETGRWIDSHVLHQDYIAWVGQGQVADRTKEHLGESDRGVLLLRRKMFDQMKVVAEGGQPMGLVTDPEANERLHLPTVGGIAPRPSPDGPLPFFHLSGQPEEITRAYREAWERCAEQASAPAVDG